MESERRGRQFFKIIKSSNTHIMRTQSDSIPQHPIKGIMSGWKGTSGPILINITQFNVFSVSSFFLLAITLLILSLPPLHLMEKNQPFNDIKMKLIEVVCWKIFFIFLLEMCLSRIFGFILMTCGSTLSGNETINFRRGNATQYKV